MTAKYINRVDDLSCESLQGQPHSHKRILVVEGEHDLRQLTAEVLMDAGFEVEVAEDGAAAWSALQGSKYELLVTDQFMPPDSGVELLKKIHAAHMAVPVIMAIGFLPAWEFAPHTWLRPVKFLATPCSFTELLGVVKNMLHETGARAETASRPARLELR